MVVRIFLWGLVTLVAVGVSVVGIGLLLPENHVAEVQEPVEASPLEVAHVIRNVPAQPGWRAEIKAIQNLHESAGGLRYTEVSDDGSIDYELKELLPDRQFRVSIISQNITYGGYWTIEVVPVRVGSLVKITETGFVRNPVFRVLGRFVFGYDSTIRSYLAGLRRAVSLPRSV